ncbi:MAG: hypothetical protein R8F63_06315 [Acidimicrobiales bacterium]|nr:hypothetical protein [Acidimicrobiales bacterium]
MSRVALVVPDEYATVAPRVRFAAGIWALAHGHEIVAPTGADHVLTYGSPLLPATPRWRPLAVPAPQPTMWDGLPLHHPQTAHGPDLLAEIFEWASSAHEAATERGDDVGRVPSADTLAVRAALSPVVPWGSRLVDALQRQLADALGIVSAPSTLGGGRRLIGASHDVDFLPTSRRDTARRLAVWAAAATTRFRAPGHAARLLTAGAARAASGRLDRGIERVARREHDRGIRATYTWLVRDEHPRDARYVAAGPAFTGRLNRIAAFGHEHAVHGSYTSLEARGRLAEEYDRLRSTVPDLCGSRQHWLRYGSTTELIGALEDAGARYDASAGFSDRIGFRTGIAHPHPLYDLDRDTVSPVIEIPTPIMDVAVADRSTTCPAWREECEAVLDAVDEHGLGGVSVLWHDPVLQGFQLPRRFADLYWELHDPDRHDWVTLAEIETAVRGRLAACGLAADTERVTPPPTHPSPVAAG